MEFALFGLGSDSGGSLLRLGEDDGEVRMVFSVDGTDYEVTRRLQRRSGKVQQAEGELKSPSETLTLSPSELKEKVLELLEFNEAPDPKAQSWIYRYAVYTPQEEMKSILSLPAEQRLQILRRAFRVEDYKTAATNAEDAARQIREDSREQDGIAKGVDELRLLVEQLQADEEGSRDELGNLEATESEADEQVAAAKAEREALQKKELSLQGVKAEMEYYERLRADALRDSAELEEELTSLGRELKEIEVSLAEAGQERPLPAGDLPGLKRKERGLEAKATKLTEMKAAVETKLSDYESIMKNGICPVCDRPADAHDFDDRKARKGAEKEHLEGELASVRMEIEALRKKIEEAEAQRDAAKEQAFKKTERARLKKEVDRKEQAKHKFVKRGSFADDALRQVEKQLEVLRGLAKETESANRKLEAAEERLRSVRDSLARARGKLEDIQKRQTEVAIEIVAKEQASNRSKRLREREIWLRDYFVPTLKAIEKSVLATINQEFDALFKTWFGMLVGDPDKEVGIDEDFTPAVSQGGYEQDVKYLSGGERTSVALAYRLALNLLAQRVSAGMKSNLLVLDEPTDGFSKEQLGSVREVMEGVRCPQVIVVSHDKELESFADQIFRITKSGDESTVRMP